MVEYYIDPEDLVVDFLRTNLTDPRARAEATESKTITATAGQTEFAVTPTTGTAYCITAVTKDGTSLRKWKDYFWDGQNSKIYLAVAATVGQSIVITFKYGTSNWIYADRPDDNLSRTGYPRIEVFSPSGNGIQLGNYEAPVEGSPILQIDIWTKDGQVFTIGSSKYANNYLGRYIGNRITRAFEKEIDDLYPALYNYNPVSLPRAGPYEEESQIYHTILEINLRGIKLGRIEY